MSKIFSVRLGDEDVARLKVIAPELPVSVAVRKAIEIAYDRVQSEVKIFRQMNQNTEQIRDLLIEFSREKSGMAAIEKQLKYLTCLFEEFARVRLINPDVWTRLQKKVMERVKS